MTIKEIIDGLKFTMDMCLFSPTDGSKRPVSMLNDMDKITYDACEGAIQALEQPQPCEECKFQGDTSFCDVCCHNYMSMFADKMQEVGE